MAKQKYDYPMVKISNKLIDELETEEFLVWCALRYRYIMYTFECTITSIDLLAEEVKLYSHATKNRNYIREILLMLHEKGHIKIDHEGELKNSTPLKIRLTNIDPITEFTALDNRYATITDHQALYVIANIRRWQNARDKTFSLEEWAGMLKVSVSTMQRIFERMEQQGLLYVVSGEYYQTAKGELRQYNNRYYLCDGQAKGKDESALDEVINTEPEQATVDEATTVESEQVVPEREPLGVQEVVEPEKQTHFNLFGETHNVSEIMARLSFSSKDKKQGKEQLWMEEVDYVYYQQHKPYLDKKTINIVEAKLRGMENSKSDYAQQQLAKMIDTYEKYQGQTARSKIRELAKTQPVVAMKDGSFTTDLDNLAIDYDDMVQIHYVYNGEFESREFIKGQKDEMGNMCERPMTAEEKQNYIGRVVESYKQKAV